MADASSCLLDAARSLSLEGNGRPEGTPAA